MAQDVEALLAEVLTRIKPGATQFKEASIFVKRLNKQLKHAGVKAKAIIAGSTAKGTFLKGDHDIDIFVRFDRKRYGEHSDKLSELLAPLLPQGSERIHGSRDYFQVKHEGYMHEIVPVLKVSKASQARNVTDMSPLHVHYAVRHIRRNKGLADEIRLAKQFCKAIKVYGAESYINGFSGHVLDLLLFRYQTFQRLLTAAAQWGTNVVIDLERHHAKPEFALEKSKRLGPMIIIDPVQPERNAAAALSHEKFERFKEAARAFLDEPALKYFKVEALTPARIRHEYEKRVDEFRVNSRLFILESEPMDGKEDVVATKLLKVHHYLVRQLKRHDFTVLDDGFEYEKQHGYALHYIVVRNQRLSEKKEWQGPPVTAKRDAKRFRDKHTGVRERKGRLYAKVRRQYRTPLQALHDLTRNQYVYDRAWRVDIV